MTRRGYALPLVLMIAVISSAVISTMINRYATMRLSTERQLDGYREFHDRAGIPEIVVAWWRLAPDEPDDFLELINQQDGLVLTATTRGERLRIWVRPGGGELPVEGAAIGSPELRAAGEILDLLRPNADELRRSVGPEQVTAGIADVSVLEAIATAVTNDSSVSARVARELSEQARSDAISSAAEVRTLASSAGMTSEQIGTFVEFISLRPSLWIIEAELTDITRTGPVQAPTRYRGLLREPENPASANDRSWFVTWERVTSDASEVLLPSRTR